MKSKLIFSTKTSSTECWTILPFTPHINEIFNVQDILMDEEVSVIKQSANHWSGVRGIVESVEYRHDDDEFYTEILVRCED
jgi:hypothetical protein